MRNLLLDELPHDVRVLFGNRKPLSMAQNLSREFAGVFFTGYHGAVGDLNATLSHTYAPSVIYEVRINGISCSEALLNAGVAGYFGVPVLLITGDRTTVEGARSHMPWLTGVVVKESIGNFAVESMSPAAAREAIRAGAAQAMAGAAGAKPYAFASPVTMKIDVVGVQQADVIEVIPGFTRTGGRQVTFVHDDYLTVFRAFVAAFRTGAVAE
jgi:D-amino peptidase